MSEVIELDERGRRCPLPVIALAKAARTYPGRTVRLLSDDPASRHDVPAWCRMKQAELVETAAWPANEAVSGDASTTQTTAFVVRLPATG